MLHFAAFERAPARRAPTSPQSCAIVLTTAHDDFQNVTKRPEKPVKKIFPLGGLS
jgi:hypothetical protein